ARALQHLRLHRRLAVTFVTTAIGEERVVTRIGRVGELVHRAVRVRAVAHGARRNATRVSQRPFVPHLRSARYAKVVLTKKSGRYHATASRSSARIATLL